MKKQLQVNLGKACSSLVKHLLKIVHRSQKVGIEVRPGSRTCRPWRCDDDGAGKISQCATWSQALNQHSRHRTVAVKGRRANHVGGAQHFARLLIGNRQHGLQTWIGTKLWSKLAVVKKHSRTLVVVQGALCLEERCHRISPGERRGNK
jgi:hypothetical protein